jgi:protein gp37
MADRSAIEWTEATWNPVTDCDRVSAGCDHCYAMTLAKRLKAMGSEKYQNDGDPRTSGPGFGVTIHPQALNEPRRWRQPRTVFVNSMSDLSVGVGTNLRVISPSQGRYSCAQQVSRTAVIAVLAEG